MPFDPEYWTRLEHDGVPVFIMPDRPDWFVPNRAGDRLLRRLLAGERPKLEAGERKFLQRLPEGAPGDYPGRGELLRTDRLREIWFHITNGCNLTCKHCLVSSAPGEKERLSARTVLGLADQARRLGCNVFALTGGEPFIHAEFETIVDGLLTADPARVVVLTNGMFLRRHERAFARWPAERLHLQISLDGLRSSHDANRGAGSFAALEAELAWLRSRRIPFTLSMCVMRENLVEMPRVVEFAAAAGASNVHFLWYFVRGRGRSAGLVPAEEIFERLLDSAHRAEALGIRIDNLSTHRSQVFSPCGTRHDGNNSGWESLAVGPDGHVYPSPALIGLNQASTPLDGDLATAWRHSRVLEELRCSTAAGLRSPLRFIVGGGDSDHSYVRAGRFVGDDPYLPLYERVALWLIAAEAARQSEDGPPRLRLKMGDILERCGERGEVALNHSNCVLALATRDHVAGIAEFYSRAVETTNEEILNPVFYPEELVAHIPRDCRVRSYGCGSPVLDAKIAPGEVVVDLGSGAGVECLIASRLVGPGGSVFGIDMLEPMLDLARRGAGAAADSLGYANVEFRKARLESLPLDDGSADVVLSNCVINLSSDKRRTFAEIARVLREGGRLVVSDVVCEDDPPASVRNDEVLRGECIAGALTQRDLMGLLDDFGFTGVRVLKRFPYREVHGHRFFSMTFEARKPGRSVRRRVIYRGPHAAIMLPDGTLLTPGATATAVLDEAQDADDAIFVIDPEGRVTNVDPGEAGESAAGCCGAGAGRPAQAVGTTTCCGAPGGEGATARTRPCCGSDPAESGGPPLLSIGEPEDSGDPEE